MSSWTVSEPQTIDLEDAIREIQISLVGGAVDIVATDGPARVEISDLEGEPLLVDVADGVLSVRYDDFAWDKVFVFRIGGKRWGRHRRAVVSIAVPADVVSKVGLVSAEATLGGLVGFSSVNTVSGEVVLDALSGGVTVKSVSGSVEMRRVTGDCNIASVSGSVTVVDGEPNGFRAKSVAGDITADIVPAEGAGISLQSVSGDVTVRLPERSVGDVDVLSTSGRLTTTLADVTVDRKPGKVRAFRHDPSIAGSLTAKTVSGDVSLVGAPRDDSAAVTLESA